VSDKVLSRSDLTERIREARVAGRTIALANGIFDLLHVGHIRYLQGAAAEADCLVVAVNDDAVAAAKGPGRPILKAADRAELVSAIRGVDYVTICSAQMSTARERTTRSRLFPNVRRSWPMAGA
jgi:cytidyltransferase-like protein